MCTPPPESEDIESIELVQARGANRGSVASFEGAQAQLRKVLCTMVG